MARTPAEKPRHLRRLLLLGGVFLAALAAVVVLWPGVRVTRQLTEARRALQRGDISAALRVLETAEALQPDRAEVQYLAAVANRRAGRLDRFEPHLQRAAELGWAEEDIQRQRWLARAQTGSVDAVQRELWAAIEGGASDEAAEEIYEAVAKGYLATYRPRDAWRCLDAWLVWRPDAPQARIMRAWVYEQVADLAPAIDDCLAALEQLPDDLAARVKLGQLLFRQNRLEEARREFQTCVAAAPGDGDALVGIAQCERRLGNAAEARRHLEAALGQELSPQQRGIALAEMGRLLLDDGKVAESVACLTQAAQWAPAENSVHYALALSLSRAGQPERAKHHHERARQIRTEYDRLCEITRRLIDSPGDAELRCEAGLILIGQGFKKEGIDWLIAALKCDPNHRKAHQLLADYYAEAGNQQLAAHHRLLAALSPPEKKSGPSGPARGADGHERSAPKR